MIPSRIHIYMKEIVKMFPVNIKAIYIRQTSETAKRESKYRYLENIEDLGVATCYFSESGKAIAHSKKIGIV